MHWIEDEPEEFPFDIKPTSEYSHGTLTIYSSPKRPKANKPAFGYKFVTERTNEAQERQT